MTEPQITDWDDAYANGAHIEGAADYPSRWASEAERFRQSHSGKELDVSYGTGVRNVLDMFLPDGAAKGLVVFVHGGYWLRFDKSFWSQLAAGCLSDGWAVCLPSYDLCPDVPIAKITRQVGSAVSLAAERIGGPIRLSGHSAGGHLVTRMLCEDTPLSEGILDRIEKVVSISGLHDLRPLRNTAMNQGLNMTEKEAVAESPALKKPASACPVVAWVGSAERPEFLRQSRLLEEAWPNVRYHEDAGRHHFDVIDGLKNPASALTSELTR